MSLMPTLWAAFENREDNPLRIPPKVMLHSDEAFVLPYLPQFTQAYTRLVQQQGTSLSPQQVHHIDITPDGAVRMIVVSNYLRDIIHLYAAGGEPKVPAPLQGFLVTLCVPNGTAVDLKNEMLYRFNFDENNFAYSKVTSLYAGDRRVHIADALYLSWDGTGGGDIAPEAGVFPQPNYYAKPFVALSGNLYHQGRKFPFLNGQIIGVGVGVAGTKVVVAESVSDTLIRLHRGTVARDPETNEVTAISYGAAIGKAVVKQKYVVNFRADLKEAVCGGTIITIPDNNLGGDFPLTTSVIVVDDKTELVVWSGYVGQTVHFTVKKTVQGTHTYGFAPHNTYESYDSFDNQDPSPIVTIGKNHVDYKYYDLSFVTGWNTSGDPTYVGALDASAQYTVIKKPIITFEMGFFPTTTYIWMRSIIVTNSTETDIFYWYRDYLTGEFVRCAYQRGYTMTEQYDEYGAAEPVEGDVLLSQTVNVNAQKLINATDQNWFYVVGNGKGDFILRKAPNGTKSDALLVSKTGQSQTVNDTYAVGII